MSNLACRFAALIIIASAHSIAAVACLWPRKGDRYRPPLATTDALFANNVERKVSNPLAHLRADDEHVYVDLVREGAVVVRPAGAVPSMMAVMIRGDTKASGARWRICRSAIGLPFDCAISQ
jgi:hypothetical protein